MCPPDGGCADRGEQDTEAGDGGLPRKSYQVAQGNIFCGRALKYVFDFILKQHAYGYIATILIAVIVSFVHTNHKEILSESDFNISDG